MAERVCPWWMGYVLASPLRKIWQDPHRILAAHVQDGMTVLEPGPGMGFFTLELARLVGSSGRVIAVDMQEKMLDALVKKAQRVGLSQQIQIRQSPPDSLGIEDLRDQVDFVLAFAVVHEFPNRDDFFRQTANVLKKNGTMLLAEPSGHVNAEAWEATLLSAKDAGLPMERPLDIARSHAALLIKRASA